MSTILFKLFTHRVDITSVRVDLDLYFSYDSIIPHLFQMSSKKIEKLKNNFVCTR